MSRCAHDMYSFEMRENKCYALYMVSYDKKEWWTHYRLSPFILLFVTETIIETSYARRSQNNNINTTADCVRIIRLWTSSSTFFSYYFVLILNNKIIQKQKDKINTPRTLESLIFNVHELLYKRCHLSLRQPICCNAFYFYVELGNISNAGCTF